ncbi:hypothetical protein AB7C87_01330 [Natrarchaeobius sp. A-rgal3]|uniref:hypothetical protein n=1 Tax=Natrarchaeobius versutus TaxID=1679078 RepID=UPI00350FF994
MTGELTERVDDVLERADAVGGAVVSGDGESTEPLLEAADEADEILASAEPSAVLEAVGLDRLPDGSEPDSIPAAIAHGDPDDVEALERLLSLAKLSDRSNGESLETAVGGLREAIESGEDETDEESPAGDGAGGSEGSEADADDGNGDDGDADEAGDFGEMLRSAMTGSFEEFGDEVSKLQERLEEAGSETAAELADDERGRDGDEDEVDGGEADEEKAEDDGFLEPDLGSDGDRGGGGGRSGRYSTVAPSPSDRADMKAVKRYSTMPDR